VDPIPHPVWRDNVLLALGRFDEDALWADTIGGLFDGFPDAEIERRGVICWASPWDFSGWEISEGVWRSWLWIRLLSRYYYTVSIYQILNAVSRVS
jgi:hypothetical protein